MKKQVLDLIQKHLNDLDRIESEADLEPRLQPVASSLKRSDYEKPRVHKAAWQIRFEAELNNKRLALILLRNDILSL